MSTKFGVECGFPRISYFGVKQGHLGSFLGEKIVFIAFLGQNMLF